MDRFNGYIAYTYELAKPFDMPFPHEATELYRNMQLITKNYIGEIEFDPIYFFFENDSYNDTISNISYNVRKLEWNDPELNDFCHWWLTGEKINTMLRRITRYDVRTMYLCVLAALGEIPVDGESSEYLIEISY